MAFPQTAPESPADPEPQVADSKSPADSKPSTDSKSPVGPESPAGPDPEAQAAPEPPAAAAESPAASEPPTAPQPQPAAEASAHDETGEEAVHTLLRTAATERPVEEVAALVARLQETGELSSPADVALRAAAVTRPLDEVRQLLALLNASGYDLHQAETTLRAAAVGRPVEDVVQLVGILGADSSDWQSTSGGEGEGRERIGGEAPPAATATTATATVGAATPQRVRNAPKGRKSPLDAALASGPGSHTASPALRSVLRWPAALALFACGLIHLPTDLSGLRSGGDAQALSVVVTVLCLACAVWLAARDTLIAWAAAAGVAVFVIALHGVAGVRTVDLLSGSLGTTFAWAKAVALLSAVGIVCLAASALVRHVRATGAADSA
ncbi:hypothetical protein ABTX77_14575 [Streptomyces sp. NPDC097704]|uniref:hypothetical protein n=1 Tax=Streptomyces sp. NPDC097704 TaxID=3157101 RepID=UPI0033315A1D